jgi:hypothetical protein
MIRLPPGYWYDSIFGLYHPTITPAVFCGSTITEFKFSHVVYYY